MFGTYSPPLSLSSKSFKMKLERGRERNSWKYYRKLKDEEKTVSLVFSKGDVIINPVEPVNLPKNISSALMIELSSPLILAPKESVKIYLTFPVEIGVLLVREKQYRVLDIFSFLPAKYTLYGEVTSGVVCKYWCSDVHFSLPKVNPLEEGVLELRVTNASGEWVDVKEAVFNAYGMKIYFDKTLVAMRGTMKVIGEEIAETNFIDAPLRERMKKAVEIYVARKVVIPVQQTKFVMEEGV